MPQNPSDLRYLYEEVRKAAPERCIQFGSGQSTPFIAQALHDRGRGHLWSLNADAKWAEHTAAILPGHLRPYVTVVHSPSVVDASYGVPA